MPEANGQYMKQKNRYLVLASGSRTRQTMLQAAGVPHTVMPADLDEHAIRETLCADNDGVDPADIAEVLARAKAEHISARERAGLVIGSDQVLSLEGKIFEKPQNVDEARSSLIELRGKTHQLHTAVALAEDGKVVWCVLETAHITMRDYSDDSLQNYLVKAGDIVCESVGAYQLEGLGVQLIEKVEGSHFTILGMPLLPLLGELRKRGMVGA